MHSNTRPNAVNARRANDHVASVGRSSASGGVPICYHHNIPCLNYLFFVLTPYYSLWNLWIFRQFFVFTISVGFVAKTVISFLMSWFEFCKCLCSGSTRFVFMSAKYRKLSWDPVYCFSCVSLQHLISLFCIHRLTTCVHKRDDRSAELYTHV